MIRVGPAGWSYPDWEGPVYPRSKPHGYHPLDLIATIVEYVEVNSTFYAPPAPETVKRWLADTPPEQTSTATGRVQSAAGHS